MKAGIMCKHCKSVAHSTVEHGKHYKGFATEKKEEREKHFKAMFDDPDADDKHKKSLPSLTTKHSGKFEGKSNALGHGGRAAQLRARGVPGGVIGNMAREAHAAPGQANYHGKHKKGMSESDMGSMRGYDPNLGLGKAGMKSTMVKAGPGYQFGGRARPVVGSPGSIKAGSPVDRGMGTQSEVMGQGGGAGSRSASTPMSQTALGGIGRSVNTIKSKHKKASPKE